MGIITDRFARFGQNICFHIISSPKPHFFILLLSWVLFALISSSCYAVATTDVANSTSPLSEIAFEKLDIEVETFKQGAEQGVPIAQLILGLFYLDGKKVAQDNEMDASYSNRHLGAKVVICD